MPQLVVHRHVSQAHRVVTDHSTVMVVMVVVVMRAPELRIFVADRVVCGGIVYVLVSVWVVVAHAHVTIVHGVVVIVLILVGVYR